jgi:hypothetical protein
MVDYLPHSSGRGSLVGLCPICETLMCRFVSEGRLDAVLRELRVQYPQLEASLRDIPEPASSCHFGDKD